MRQVPLAVVLLGSSLWLVACAGLHVRTDHDPEVRFEDYRSYAWLDPPLRERPREADELAPDPFTHNTLIDQRLRAEVEQVLGERGFEKVESQSADFLLRYHLLSRERIESSPAYAAGGFGRHHYVGGGVYYGGIQSYREGTLVLDLVDPETERITWRGWSDRRNRGAHPDADALIADVKHILERFPPER